MWRGEFALARNAAESFLSEAQRAPRPTKTAVAHNNLGFALFVQGEFAQARAHLEQTLRIYDPVRDREAKFRFGSDGLALYLCFGSLASAWARAKVSDRDAGSTEFRQALAEYAGQGNKLSLPFYRGLLAEIESEGHGAEAALTGIDEALVLAGETGEHWFDAGLHRIRGEILLKQNPADPAPAPAEAAFLTAIAIAQQRKSPQLRAARRAVACQTLSVHRPPDRRPRRSRPRAGRLFADAGVSADRRGEGAPRVACQFVSGVRFGVSQLRRTFGLRVRRSMTKCAGEPGRTVVHLERASEAGGADDA